ncbi:hypothetical protein TNCV_1918201 [Trichonephila clavipes]|nr:hypothetical protein TNCV_1918201 [Trichonephila clavipes]
MYISGKQAHDQEKGGDVTFYFKVHDFNIKSSLPSSNQRSPIANASCTAIGPPPLKSRPSLQVQVSKTMKIRVPDRG